MEKLPNSLINPTRDWHCGVSWGLLVPLIELGIWESKQWSHLIVDMRTSDDRPAFSSYHLLQLLVHRWNCLLKYTGGYIAVRCVAWERRQAEWSQSSHCYGASWENSQTRRRIIWGALRKKYPRILPFMPSLSALVASSSRLVFILHSGTFNMSSLYFIM